MCAVIATCRMLVYPLEMTQTLKIVTEAISKGLRQGKSFSNLRSTKFTAAYSNKKKACGYSETHHNCSTTSDIEGGYHCCVFTKRKIIQVLIGWVKKWNKLVSVENRILKSTITTISYHLFEVFHISRKLNHL